MKKTNKFLHLIISFTKISLYSILTLIIIYNTSIIFQKVSSPNEIPNFFGYKNLIIKSGSMTPAINVGDMVIIKKVKKEDLAVGDIISYKNKNSIITHRIIEKKYNSNIVFTTKGDYNNTPDKEEVIEENIEGKVLLVIPKIGNIALLLQNQTVFILIISIMLILIYIKYQKDNNNQEKIDA